MFNWLGNKIKYIDYLKKYSRNFKTVIDPMMGSGNVLIELVKDHDVIGNELVRLMPELYTNIDQFSTSAKDFEKIINDWLFIAKENYYLFRDAWNIEYTSQNYSKLFLIKTFLLFKMCSNSVVRFNLKNQFNSGFRGVGEKPFFHGKDLNKWEKELTLIKENLSCNKSEFFSMNVVKFLKFLKFDILNSIFIFDPPYLLNTGCYSDKLYNEDTEKQIFDFITDNKVYFVFFNFLSRDKDIHEELDYFITNNHFDVVELNTKSATGQNRKKTHDVKEILITNIKE